MKKAFQRVQTVTTGFKHLYLESKEVWKLSKLNPHVISRRERELIRTNKESVKKVAVFFIAQLPPVIGLVPIAIALTFPKHILSHHFWSEEQKENFLFEDRSRQISLSQDALGDILPFLHLGQARLPATSTLDSPHKVTAEETMAILKAAEYDWRKLHSWTTIFHHHHLLPDINTTRQHRLIQAHNICDSRIMEVTMPHWLLHSWLLQRAKDIVEDDLLLLQEGLTPLSHSELQTAAFRRGLSPYESTTNLQASLDYWLQEQVTQQERERIVSEIRGHSREPLFTYALFYLQAFNAANQVLIAPK